MGQERFADVVERFTNGFAAAGAPASPETIKQWQEELDRNVRRMTNLAKLAVAPEPRTGQTPRQEIYKRNKSRLYRYESSRRHRTPVLFVPNLGSAARTSSTCCPAAPSSST
jgi:hypothetical protein